MSRKKIKYGQISLVNQVFIFLLGAASISILIVGTFWLNSKIGEHRKEVKKIKATFSQNQRESIRSKILQTKNYLDWIRAHPAGPVSALLKEQAVDVSYLAGNAYGKERLADQIARAGNDTLFCLMIPFSVYNDKKEIVYEYRPRIYETDPVQAEIKAMVLSRIFNSIDTAGTIIHSLPEEQNQEWPAVITGFAKNPAAGLTVVSMACGKEQITEALKIYALDSISRIRFAVNEYVFVNSMDGYALVTHGKLNPAPRKISETGNRIWQDIYEVQKTSALHQEGVFHSYPWPLLESTDTSLKTSYFSYYPKWGWIIGTGYYEKDVEPLIDTLRKELIADLRGNIASIALYIIFATLLCYFLARYLSGQIYKNLEIFKVFFERSVKADERIDMS
nr:cache domain-containing protein [Bacteroidales bacterium]